MTRMQILSKTQRQTHSTQSKTNKQNNGMMKKQQAASWFQLKNINSQKHFLKQNSMYKNIYMYQTKNIIHRE